MVIFIYSLVTLLFGAILNYQKKNIPLIHQLIIFLSASMLIMNISSILWLNLHFIEYPLRKESFIAFIVYRNALLPLLILIFINFQESTISPTSKWVVGLCVMASFLGLEYMSLGLKITHYKNWNIILSALLFTVYTVISILVLKLLMGQETRKEGTP